MTTKKFKIIKPTKDTYLSLIEAYEFYNKNLFYNRLPGCIFVFKSKKNMLGHFWGDIWHKDNEITDKITLNSNYICFENIMVTLKTIVHEMTHQWQHHFGDYPTKNKAYHNKEWSEKMISIGLMPSSTGKLGGNKTGQRMSNYVVGGGTFEKVTNDLINVDKFDIPWEIYTSEINKVKQYKFKYECNMCNIKVWGRHDLNIICGNCNNEMFS